MNNELAILCVSAVSIGFFHTLFGPDHYLPFIVMSKSGNWSRTKTVVITALCGVGHVLGSVILGFVGIIVGIGLGKLELFEEIRGNIAAFLLIGFGLVYMVWGIYRAVRNKPHRHVHVHDGMLEHSHDHAHTDDHVHVHADKKKNLTPWILFVIFVFGPCEPLIPLLMYPAARESALGVVTVALVFSMVTIGTMIGITLISVFGLNLVKMKKLERYTHVLAGGTIFLSGVAIQVLGL